MTMNYNIGMVETKPLVLRKNWNEEKQRYEDDFGLIKTQIEWISHGNYALIQPKDDRTIREDKNSAYIPYIWIELEAEYFDQILNAIEEKSLPTTAEEMFEPFWKATLPPRGMHFDETQLRTYFWGRGKKGFLLHRQRNNPFWGGMPCNKIDELGFNVEDFKKIRDVALNPNADKPFHCCQMTL